MIALYVAFYMIILTQRYGDIAVVPYQDKAQCDRVAHDLTNNGKGITLAYCIEGNKP